MPVYETVFMSRQDLTEGQVKDLTDKYTKVITDQGGKILKTEQWGLRTLAYKINKARKAHYTLVEFEGAGAAVIELERLLRLDEDVMRSLSIRLDAATEGPSVMMGKPGRDNDNEKNEKEAA
ncbi:MAG: 30S ribosomal protein S6 [Pseudomonadota bacterium]